MRGKAAARYAFFLVLLVLGQEFSIARYLHAPVRRDAQGSSPEEEENPEEERGLARYDERAERKRRGVIGIILLGTALGFTLAELTTEIYLKIVGCCSKLFRPELCRHAETFKKQKALMEKTNKEIDSKVLEAKHILTDVELGNGQFSIVASKVMHIMSQQEALLTALHPDIIKDFQTKWSEIIAAVRKKNQTVNTWTIAELQLAFQSVFDSLEGTMLTMGGIFASVLEGAVVLGYSMYRTNKINKKLAEFAKPSSGEYKMLVNARHTKAARTMGVDRVGINKHIELTKEGMKNAKLKGDGTTGKWARGLKYTGYAISGLIVLASGALTVYSIMMKVDQCDKLAKGAEDGANKITNANIQLGKLNKNLTDYTAQLNKVGVNYMTTQLRDKEFLETLRQIKSLLLSKTNANSTYALRMIETYLAKIGNATLAQSYDLTTMLIKGLGHVEYIYKCLTNKVKLQNDIVRQCKLGTRNLDQIWQDGSQSWSTEDKECLSKTNITYYSLDDARDGLNKTATRQGFKLDCKLNNAAYKRAACRHLFKDKMTPAQAYREMNGSLSIAQVIAITQDCPPLNLTPSEKANICVYRTMKWTDEFIWKMVLKHVALAEIKAYKCP